MGFYTTRKGHPTYREAAQIATPDSHVPDVTPTVREARVSVSGAILPGPHGAARMDVIEVNNTVLKSITSGLDPPVRPPLCNELWRRNRGDAHCSVGVRARAGYSPALQRCPVAHFILQRTVGEAAPRSSLRQIMHVGERVGPASAVVRLEWLTWLHSPQRLGAAWRLGQRNSKLFAPSCSCLCGDF